MGVTPDAEVTPDMGRCTSLEIMQMRGRFISALAGSNQVKYIRIFLLFLNSELCPGVTPCPNLPYSSSHVLLRFHTGYFVYLLYRHLFIYRRLIFICRFFHMALLCFHMAQLFCVRIVGGR